MHSKLKHFFLIWGLIFCSGFSSAHNPANKSHNITFTENKNQWPSQIIYRAQLDGGALFLEKNGFTYSFYDKEKLRKLHAFNGAGEDSKQENLSPNIRSHAYKMTFKNSNQANVITTQPSHPSSDYTNYFIGKDPAKWASDIRSYEEVKYRNLYPGIDMEVIGQNNSVKYNFIVNPKGKTSVIAMEYEGVDGISLEEGKLKIKTSLNEIIEQRPYAYQEIKGERITVPCEFMLKGKQVSFVFESGYNQQYPLIIDPTLIFASYSGSYADNFGMTATYDSHGNLYSGGTAFDQGFPTTLGAYDTTYNGIVTYGRTDVVITKYDSSGSNLIYSTYLGGLTGSEIVTSLIVNNQDEIYMYGATGSSDFPMSTNAYSKIYKGGDTLRFMFNGTYFDNGTDIFVAKLNSGGTGLLGSTYIGGSKNDGVNHNNLKTTIYYNCFPCDSITEYWLDSLQYNYGDQYRGEIMLDNVGNCYIASSTRSADFPIVNGFDASLGGQQDAIVLKFNSNLSTLLWSTYLGGDDNDAGYSLAVDDSSVVYVTGGTRSADFPTTPGVLNKNYLGGKADGYITKINKNGSAILSSTFIGTNQYDQSYFVQLDKDKSVYLVGQTAGTFPVSAGVYSNPNSGQFIAKLNNALSSMVFSTVFGNGGNRVGISPAAFLVDDCENIYVSGWGGNIVTGVRTLNMPLTPDAIQKTTDGFNFYLFVLSKNALSLQYATYFGGPLSQEHVDGGTSRFDKRGIIYQSVCAGCGRNSDFPTTPGAWSNTNNSDNCNNGTFKFDFGLKLASADFVSKQEGCAPLTIEFEKTSKPGSSYLWDFGNNDTTSTVVNPVRTYTTPGQYLAKLIVIDSLSCNIADTSFKYITVHPGLQNQNTVEKTSCANSCNGSVSVTVNGGTAPFIYTWSSGQNSPSVTNLCPGNYELKITDAYGCIDSVTVQVTAPPALSSVIERIHPQCGMACDAKAWASVSGGESPYSFLWSDPLSQTNDTAVNLCNGSYTVAISDAKGCKENNTILVNYSSEFPNIKATADKDTLYTGESTSLHVTSAYKYTFQWSPGTNLNTTTSANPIASPKSTTTYKVAVQDSLGCESSDFVTIHVKNILCTDPEVFIPNGFSPNDDGTNDILYVRGKTIQEMYLAVYDRWGEKIFESTSQQSGWDGRFKGEKVTPAVYAYYLKVRCVNQQEYFKKGNVTVIR